jgi:hypothetical protein
MALPTRRFPVPGTLFGLGGKAAGGREQADHRQRLDGQRLNDQSRDGQPRDSPGTDGDAKPDGMEPPRNFTSRADIERAHPPRVYRLEGATWCEVKIGGKEVD